jgi:hypothetical protein
MTRHASLARRVTFSAAHRYRRPEWDDAKNEEVQRAIIAGDATLSATWRPDA